VYAKIPETVKMITGTPASTLEQNGVASPTVITVSSSEGSTPSQPTNTETKVEAPTRRSVRQAQRKKRKHGFIPKITIKPIVQPKSEGKRCIWQVYHKI